MRSTPKLRFTLAIALALVPATLRAAEPPCLTTGEFTALAGYALPASIDGVARRCSAALPVDAFLRTGAATLAARYAQAKPGAWLGAKAAFLKLGNLDPTAGRLLQMLPDDTLQQVVDGAVQAKVADSVPLERCGAANRLLQLLAPLPPENTAELIALAVGLGAGAESSGSPTALAHAGRLGKITVCPMETPRAH
jgi:hypothetical protein